MTIVAERAPRETMLPLVPEPTPPRRSRSGRYHGVLAVLVPTVFVSSHAAYYGLWIEDDVGITYAYARSITTGYGFVLQPGADPVEAYSNPLWLAVLTLGRLLGIFDHGTWLGIPDIVAFPKLIALVCCVAIFSCFYSIARCITSRPTLVTALAGCITAAVPSFVIWSFSGLENPLFALLAVAMATVLVRAVHNDRLFGRRTALTCGLLAAAAALTRPDGLIYVLALPLTAGLLTDRIHLREGLRAALHSFAAFIVPFGAYEVFRLVTFSYWLPNTARAKAQGVPGLADLNRPAELISYAGWLAVAVSLVAVVVVMMKARLSARLLLAPLLVTLGLALVAFAILRTDWMAQARFATPIWPLAALTAVLAVGLTIPELRMRGRVVAALAVAAAVALSTAGWFQFAYIFQQNPTTPMCRVAMRTGMTVNTYADLLGIRTGSIAGVDAGGTSLTSRLQFVDLAGLANEAIANFWQQEDMVGYRNYIFDEAHPTFIQLWDDWGITTTLALDPRLSRDYVQILFPSPITGTWVRKDAVKDQARLERTQLWATTAQADLIARFRAGLRNGWQCASTLQKAPYRPAATQGGP